MTDSLIYYRKKLLETTNLSVVSNADGDTLDNDLIFQDGINYLVLPVTPEQYKNLLSACINGVFTTFPENPIGVLYPLIKAGKVSLCDAIAACINDPQSGVSDAIYNLFGGDSYESSRGNGQSQNDVDLSSGLNPTCDKDILFGQIVQLVDYLDQLNTDFFEILEVATNTSEFLASVVGDITFIDETSLDAALSWIAFIQDSIAENYAAQVTQAYKDQLACDILCASQSNCEVTPRILYDIFKDRLSSSVSLEGVIWDTLDFLAGGSWSGSQIADFMFYGQLALRSQLGKYFEKFAYQDIETRLSIYSNDPDSDWTTLCPECVFDWEQVFDFTQELYSEDWVATNPTYPPIWITDTAMEGGRDANGCRDGARFDFAARTVTFVEAEFSYQNTATNTRDSGFTAGNDTNTVLIDERDTKLGTGSYNYEWNGSIDNVDRVQLKFGSRGGASSFSRCTKLTIRGLGTNPF